MNVLIISSLLAVFSLAGVVGVFVHAATKEAMNGTPAIEALSKKWQTCFATGVLVSWIGLLVGLIQVLA